MHTAGVTDPIESLIVWLKGHEPFGTVELRDVALDESGSGSGSGDDDGEEIRLLVYLANPTPPQAGWPVDDVFQMRREISRYLAGRETGLPPLIVKFLPETADREEDVDESLEWDPGRVVEDDPDE